MNGKAQLNSASRWKAAHFSGALLGCTMLAGMPSLAVAQGAAAQADANSTSAPASAVQGDVIRSIAVSGAQRLEPATIASYVRLNPGEIYTAALADQALKDLAATELFSDFRIRNNGGNVVIEVTENPVINRIVLEGNKRIKNEKILPEINLAARQIFTRSKVRADVARIIELYKRQGRFAATVEPKMVQLDQNRVDVVFEINEGPRSRVRQINIIGNEQFSDSQLRGEMVTKQAGITKILSSGTTYDPDRMAYDQQQVRAFYLKNGYVDFRVVSAVAELTPDKRDFIITYVVEEGERYKFGEVTVDSELREFDGKTMANRLPTRTGNWYDAKLVEDTMESINQTAGTFGYAFADVRPQFKPNRDTLTMDVTFVIKEAPRVYVERIDVNGNTLTQDKVLRREFRLAEGDAFNSLAVNRSTARINSLGFFQENFKVEQTEGSAPDRIVLQANVQEKPTGELSLSAGFSSLESFLFQGSIRQRNFRGRGQTVGLSLNYSRYNRAGSINFTEPYLFDKNISAGVDLYRRDYNNGYYRRATATYEQAQTGIQFRVGVPLSERLTLIGRYTFNHDNITVDENQYFSDLENSGVRKCEPLLAGRYLCDSLGKRTTSMLGTSLVYDNLDNRMRPTAGERATVSFDFAGLGGTTRYARFTGDASKYWNLGSGFILSAKAEGGFIKGLRDRGLGSDDVLLTDRFFLGEPQIRGFDIRGVGPRVVRQYYVKGENGNPELLPFKDRSTVHDALGGRAYYLGKIELDLPLGSGAREMGLRPSLFLDVGSVFGVKRPPTVDLPEGRNIQGKNAEGQLLWRQGDKIVTNQTHEVNGVQVENEPYYALSLPAFRETFYGNTPKPRIAIGAGVNWNSPFGPFRIDVAYPLLKAEGDETKLFSFNVGTQF